MKWTAGATFGALAVSACADGTAWSTPAVFPFSAEAGRPATFAEVFEVVDTIVLEEDPVADVVTAMPFVRFDGRDFLVADFQGYQARVYATSGKLLAFRGRAGQGPGEFIAPISARRTADGDLLVADVGENRLTVFPSDSVGEPETMPLPVYPFDAIDMGKRRYLITGFRMSALHPDSVGSLLHVWNAETETVEASFFKPPRPDYLGTVASRGEYAHANVRDEAIWVVSAFTDSVFVLGMDGKRAGAISIPLATQPPADAPERWEVDKLHFLTNGCLVVEVGIRVGRTRDVDRQHLLILDGDGKALAALADTPMLRVVADDLFYFQNPDRMEPNHWIVARWRAS